jgi:hypothetical protein
MDALTNSDLLVDIESTEVVASTNVAGYAAKPAGHAADMASAVTLMHDFVQNFLQKLSTLDDPSSIAIAGKVTTEAQLISLKAQLAGSDSALQPKNNQPERSPDPSHAHDFMAQPGQREKSDGS